MTSRKQIKRASNETSTYSAQSLTNKIHKQPAASQSRANKNGWCDALVHVCQINRVQYTHIGKRFFVCSSTIMLTRVQSRYCEYEENSLFANVGGKHFGNFVSQCNWFLSGFRYVCLSIRNSKEARTWMPRWHYMFIIDQIKHIFSKWGAAKTCTRWILPHDRSIYAFRKQGSKK